MSRFLGCIEPGSIMACLDKTGPYGHGISERNGKRASRKLVPPFVKFQVMPFVPPISDSCYILCIVPCMLDINGQTISFQSRDRLAGVIDSCKISTGVRMLSTCRCHFFPSLAASVNDDFCGSRASRKTLVTLARLIHRSNGSSQFRKDRIVWWSFLCMHILQDAPLVLSSVIGSHLM